MNRILLAATGALALAPASVSAATVSSYSASALISVSLVSATYRATGLDAYDALYLGQWQDGGDSASLNEGTGSFAGKIDSSGWPHDQRVEIGEFFEYGWSVEGYATADESHGLSYGAGWITPAFSYECGYSPYGPCSALDAIRLTFDFSVETLVETVISNSISGTASASADAVLGFQYLHGGFGSCCGYDLAIQNGRGRYSVDLLPGDGFGLDLYVIGVSGTAAYSPPPVVPLPAALPLLAAGLGGLGFIGRRRKTKAA